MPPLIETFSTLDPVVQALLATLFTWFMTALGAATVFAGRELNQKILDWSLGFAGGVMIAASYWSLLAPAIEISERQSLPAWLPALAGFLFGGIFLRGIDYLLPHMHIGEDKPEGIKTTWQRTTLLIVAITLHNFPEGLAIGVAFGAIVQGLETATVTGAIALAIGIGIQNFPEGIAVSMPLRRIGISPLKSFWYGQLSAIVEPTAGVLGAAVVIWARAMLPYALAFAAGAMIFVVVEDLIPESHRAGHVDLATTGVMVGFALMMVLDVAFG